MRLPTQAHPVLRTLGPAGVLENGVMPSPEYCPTCPKGRMCKFCALWANSWGCDHNGEPYVNCFPF